MKATFKRAKPYADDALNLPVKDVESAIPYYERTFGFRAIKQTNVGGRAYRAFFDIAPDGLCYMIAQPVE